MGKLACLSHGQLVWPSCRRRPTSWHSGPLKALHFALIVWLSSLYHYLQGSSIYILVNLFHHSLFCLEPAHQLIIDRG